MKITRLPALESVAASSGDPGYEIALGAVQGYEIKGGIVLNSNRSSFRRLPVAGSSHPRLNFESGSRKSTLLLSSPAFDPLVRFA